jgi:hypothetical protein
MSDSIIEDSPTFNGSWLIDTYWYVPDRYLPALLALNASEPRIVTVQDQTVWHITNYSSGYISGISASNIGFGWSYMLMVGSVMPNGAVKLSFSPLGDANADDPSTQSITIGDGSLLGEIALGENANAEFLMQMTAGTVDASVTHWARMRPVTPADPEWLSLPGYPTTGVPDLTGLQTSIVYE